MNGPFPISPIPFVPRPLRGEAMSSWLGRVAGFYHVSVFRLLDHLGIVLLDRPQMHWLGIPPLLPSQLELLSARLRVSMDQLRLLNPSPHVMAGDTGLSYCPRCFVEDRRSGRVLHWRREWLISWNVSCPKHQRFLAHLKAIPKQLLNFWNLNNNDLARRLCCLRSPIPLPWEERVLWEVTSLCDALSSKDHALLGIKERFGELPCWALRTVCLDLADALLIEAPFEGNFLMRLRRLINRGPSEKDFTCNILFERHRRLAAISQPKPRAFALYVISRLLEGCLYSSKSHHRSLDSHCAFRHLWFWLLLPTHARAILQLNSQTWPFDYRERYWPELQMTDDELDEHVTDLHLHFGDSLSFAHHRIALRSILSFTELRHRTPKKSRRFIVH